MRSLGLLALTAFLPIAQTALIDNGTVVTLNGIAYYAGGVPIAHLGSNCTRQAILTAATLPDQDLFPMTIAETSVETLDISSLDSIPEQYNAEDDVFQPAFLRTLYVRSVGPRRTAINVSTLYASLSAQNVALLIAPGGLSGDVTGSTLATAIDSIRKSIPKGPYFVSALNGNIYKAHRLYPDDNLAFVQGVISDEQGAYISLTAVTENVMTKSVAVPSRLYFTATDEQPLAGLRLGVKDIFHIKGIATSGGSRAYFYLYGPQNHTAPAVQRLIDLGAVVVGKMGTVQFANGDRPTADWVDLHAPFNPRGDGYQLLSGSSTGSGVGVAAYDWLDLAVGSDTGGSMRGPAGVDGIFGNRPSTGAISLDHVLPLSPVSDSVGMFARSGALWAKATQAWYPNQTTNYTSFPKTLYRAVAASDMTDGTISPEVMTLVDTFVTGLETFLGVNATETNYTALWEETRGDARPKSLADMLYLTYAVYVSHDQWKLLGQPFFAEYAAKNGGRRPFVNPGPLARWTWSLTHATDEIYEQGLRNISLFKSWYETEGYGRSDPESCSESLYVYLWGNGQPSYRNVYTTDPTPPVGFGDSSVAIMAGVPEIVVPIGEVAYNSTVTLQTEYLPVSMALRVARGCDHMLASLVAGLEEAGVLRSVATGTRLYP